MSCRLGCDGAHLLAAHRRRGAPQEEEQQQGAAHACSSACSSPGAHHFCTASEGRARTCLHSEYWRHFRDPRLRSSATVAPPRVSARLLASQQSHPLFHPLPANRVTIHLPVIGRAALMPSTQQPTRAATTSTGAVGRWPPTTGGLGSPSSSPIVCGLVAPASDRSVRAAALAEGRGGGGECAPEPRRWLVHRASRSNEQRTGAVCAAVIGALHKTAAAARAHG